MAEHTHTAHAEEHLSPFARLLLMLREERADLAALLVYVAVTGLLSLAVPLAAQALVNTIAAGVFVQPLIVLTLIVFISLVFAGGLRLLKLMLLERLQQRVFARVALHLSAHLPRVQHSALLMTYAPQLVNRFFDVLTVQKTLSKLLIDGPTAVLQIGIGLLLMSFYSPLLLAFDVFIILFLVFVVWVLGAGGLRTSIKESVHKYHVAEWLEEIGRCQTSFKSYSAPAYTVERTDSQVLDYITSRRAHFRVIFRQAIGHYLFRALASAGVLAIGGWLVINRELSLGQLVAANLVIVSVLAAIEKLIGLLESVYDLLTAVDKIGHLTDLPRERQGGRLLNPAPAGADVVCRNVRFSYRANIEVLSGLNLQVNAGERVSLVGKSGAGKSTLAALLCGLLEPTHGAVLINKMDVREASLDSLRETVALVGSANEVFEGTVEENVLLGRNHLSQQDLTWALEIAQLGGDLVHLPQGIQTQLLSEGRNLSRGQIQRLLIARAVIGRPQLLILDEAFTGIDEQDKLLILDALFDSANNWTIIDISHDPEVVMRSSIIYVLKQGQIVQSDTPDNLTRHKQGAFSTLFPSLTAAS